MALTISEFFAAAGASLKSVAKVALQSRRDTVTRAHRGRSRLLVMGNGPSLGADIAGHGDELRRETTMAVNFAALAPEFARLRPTYYVLADPHFFSRSDDANLRRLRQALRDVDWPMTVFVPVGARFDATSPHVRVERFNPVGVEGFRWLRHWAYRTGLGMPRPRNVLVPALMCAMRAGYRNIAVLGADHSWMRTLAVNDDNEVVSVQPHFYSDDAEESRRVAQVYKGVRLHQVIMSFYVAFRAYHDIAAWARARGVSITNATPGSMIDAFPRGPAFPEKGK